MRKTILNLSNIILSFVVISTSCFCSDIIKKEAINKTLFFSTSATAKELAIDNIQGSIDISGENRDDVLLAVHKLIKARSDKKVEQANEEIKLDISEDDEVISLYVDAPFRQADGSVNYKGYHHYGYEVTFNFEVKVPSDVAIFLRTINDGTISVRNVAGDFDVKNINGSIAMSDLSGSGKAYALNGNVEINFQKNPHSDCYFGSLNGDVNIFFVDGLAADLSIKTFNGNVYTNFPVMYLPHHAVEKEKKGNKFVYKTGKTTKVRIAEGGANIELDAFNGEINIMKK